MSGLADTLRAATGEAPPVGLSAPAQALWWIARGGFATGPEWEKAHVICQQDEGEPGHDLVHALLHGIEGDSWNSDYWYRRAGRSRTSDDPEAEWEAVAEALSGTSRSG